MKTIDLYRKWYDSHRFSEKKLEEIRRALSGTFVARINQSEPILAPNIITNEGLDSLLDVYLAAGTQITTWRIALVKTNTTAAAGMTYAVPVYTEVAGSDVSESTRAIWTPGAVASASVTNNASPGQYTAATGFTAYALNLVGGGSAPSTIADTAGGGTLYAYGLFTGGSRTLVATDVIECSYQHGSADDGV